MVFQRAGETDCHTSDIGHWFAMTNYQPCVKQLSMMNRTSIADYIAKINEQKQLRSGGTDLMALRDQLKKKKGYEG